MGQAEGCYVPQQGIDPVIGHPMAQKPLLGRGFPMPVWDDCLDAPVQRRPTARVVALLCVDVTQSSESRKVWGLHWHNQLRDRNGKWRGKD